MANAAEYGQWIPTFGAARRPDRFGFCHLNELLADVFKQITMIYLLRSCSSYDYTMFNNNSKM
jgi:hypothetical protein